MNFAPLILDYLQSQRGFTEILLVPGAYPCVRAAKNIEAMNDDVLTADDIISTLSSLFERIPSATLALGNEGVFSFGIPNRGRFRVSYITQRGSYVVSIAEIPLDNPELIELLGSEQAKLAEREILQRSSGLLVIAASAELHANTLAYSLLRKINDSRRDLIITIEPCLTYLLKHQASVVVQMEVGSDVPSLPAGVKAALTLAPDVLYVRNVSTHEECEMILRAVKQSALTIVTISRSDLESLFPSGKVNLESGQLIGFWQIDKSSDGKLQLSIT